MATDLNKLKQFLRPATADEVRRARLAEEQEPVEAGFVFALEAEMQDEFLACAHAVAREQAVEEANRLYRDSPPRQRIELNFRFDSRCKCDAR